MLTFLKNGYFGQKAALNRWLEGQVLSGKSAWELAKLYPSGRRMFYVDFQIYQNLTAAQWLRRRRMELAAVWIRHGNSSLVAISKALGYAEKNRFRHDYITEHLHAPEREERLCDAPTLSDDLLWVCLRPFWSFDANTLRQDLVARAYQPMPRSDGPRRRRRKQAAQNCSTPPKESALSCAGAALPGWAASQPCDGSDYSSVHENDDSEDKPVPDAPAPPTMSTTKRRWEPQSARFRIYETALPGMPDIHRNAAGKRLGIARSNPALGNFWNLETTGIPDLIPFPPATAASPLFVTRAVAEQAA